MGALVGEGGDGGSGAGNGGGTGSVTGGGAGGGAGATDGLPCDVATLINSKCASCHGSPLAGGAPVKLLSRADFLATSARDATKTEAQRSLLRMQDLASPMPPGGGLTAAEISAFDAWVTASLPVGSCGAIDAGPAPTTCASTSFWTFGNLESADMNPGLACLTCHQSLAPDKAYPYSGTVFPSLHEKDRCNAGGASGMTVQIIDKNGAVAVTMAVSPNSGNFFSDFPVPAVLLPYTATVTYQNRTARMTTPQMNGDCNSCHTEQGANGASGRIVQP